MIKLTRIAKIQGFSAPVTSQVLVETIESLPDQFVKSITFDNGGESARHYQLREPYSIQTFHCDPYKSWQKGGVENTNGLIRQYFPRTTNLAEVSDEEIYRVQEKLNNRPRKSLDYRTPNELLTEYREKMLH